MRVRHWAMTMAMSFVVASASFVLPTTSAIFTQPASAALNTNLCSPYNDSRGPVSDDFVLDACVTGTSIVVSNNHSFPVEISRGPADPNTGVQSVGALQPISLSQDSYDKIMRTAYLASGATGDLLLPGDVVSYPIGPGRAEIDVSQVSDNMNAFFAVAQFLTAVHPELGVADTVRDFATGWVEGEQEYHNCLANRPNTHASLTGCLKSATGTVLGLDASLVIGLGAKPLLGLALAFGSFVQAATAEGFVFDESTTYLIQGPQLSITNTSLGNATVGSQYSQTLQATGGTTPYTWSISSGSLPDGLKLVPSTGEIIGTPTSAGTSTFDVTVTDSTSPNPVTAHKTFSIQVGSGASGGVILQTGNTAARTASTLSGTFTDQLTTNQSGAVTFVTTTPSSGVTVSPTGAVSASPNLGLGTSYSVKGTDSDQNGDTGFWSYSLAVVDYGPCLSGCSFQMSVAPGPNSPSELYLNVPNPSACGTGSVDPTTGSISLSGGCYPYFFADIGGHVVACPNSYQGIVQPAGCESSGVNIWNYLNTVVCSGGDPTVCSAVPSGNTLPFDFGAESTWLPELAYWGGTPTSSDFFWTETYYWDGNDADAPVYLGNSNAVNFP